jgi:hypothetical protein
MTATRRSSRPVKPTAKVQESAQVAASKATMAKKIGAWPMEAVKSADEGPRPTKHARREAESPTHTVLARCFKKPQRDSWATKPKQKHAERHAQAGR